jgi:uncharacterized protein (TIGR02996 family)
VSLDALLARWRERPHAELAGAIDVVSDGLARPPLAAKNLDELHAAWLAREAQHDPGDLPILLAAMRRQRSANAIAEMRLLMAWPRDPRTTTFLVALFEDPPYWSRAAFEEVLGLCGRAGDPRLGPFLARKDLLRHFLGGFETAVRTAIKKRAAEIVARTPLAPPIDDETAALVRDAAPKKRAPDDALAAVYADPTNDAPKLVYADALVEAGDPRGELILLQAGQKRGSKKRIGELVKKHARVWLGPLYDAVALDTVVWELGFPVEIDVDVERHAELRRTKGDPRWSTIRRVNATLCFDLETLTDPATRSLWRVALGPGALDDVVGAGRALRWTDVFCSRPVLSPSVHAALPKIFPSLVSFGMQADRWRAVITGDRLELSIGTAVDGEMVAQFWRLAEIIRPKELALKCNRASDEAAIREVLLKAGQRRV